jgi:O-antigen/teichoic acid export membrane protein
MAADGPALEQAPALDLLDTSAAGPVAIRGSVLRVSAYAAGVLLSVGSASLLVRHLGVVDFGHYATVMSLITVCAGVTDLGITAIGVRDYSTRVGADRDRLLRNLLGVRIAATCAGVAGATLFALAAGYERPLVIGTVLAGIGMTIQATQAFYATPLLSQLRLGAVSALELLRQAVVVATIAALALAGAALLPFLAVTIPAAVVTLACTYPFVRGKVPLRPTLERSQVGPLIREALPFSAATAAYVVYFRVAIVLMSLIATAAQTGYFATSFRIIEVLGLVPSLVVGALFPVLVRAARDDASRFTHALARTMHVSVLAGVWLAVAIALGAPTAIRLVAGPHFAPSTPVLRIQGVALAGTFVTVAAQFGLLSLRRYRSILAADLVALALAAAAVAALVPLDGARGAAIATTAVELLLAAASVALLAAAGGPTRFLGRLLPRVAVAAALAAAVQLIPIPPVARAAVATIVYIAALQALRAIPPELWAALRRRA